jgi:hypothetical protein
MRKSIWTNLMLEVVAEMAAVGKSASQIAGAIVKAFDVDVTRSAVAGLCHRRNIKLGAYSVSKRRLHSLPEKKPPTIVGSPRPKRALIGRETTSIVEQNVAPKVEIGPIGVGLLDLEWRSCRYAIGADSEVVGTHVFCGGRGEHRPLAHGPYCETHYKMMIVPRQGG